MPDLFSTGEIVDREHRFPLRVYYAETDAYGVVYYASYLSYAERARNEMLRLLGISLKEMSSKADCVFVVRHVEADYLSSAVFDDLITIVTRLVKIGGASVAIEQIVKRNEEDLVRMRLKLVYVKLGGRSVRMPAEMRALLQEYVKETD